MMLTDLIDMPLEAEARFVEIGHGKAARRHMQQFYIGDLEEDEAYRQAKREQEQENR